jgi:uncharacterized delta-60 repeat protein
MERDGLIMKKRFVVSLVFLLSAFAIISCSSRHVAEKPDTTMPSIVATSPADGATAITVTTAVTCTFSEAMNALTINDSSFLLVSVTSDSTTVVTGNVSYDGSSSVASFTPNSPLEHNTNYIATITTDVTDAAGNAMSASFSWSFTTIPAPGALDTTFGTGGKVRLALGFSNDTAFAAAIQQDGKLVTAGYSTLTTVMTSTVASTTTIEYYFTISRFQPSGAFDTTFGFTQNGWSDDIVGTARAVELQPDEKIVAAGDTGATSTISAVTTTLATTITTTNSNSDFLMARYNANGTLDTTFGLQSNGTVIIDMGYDHDVVHSMAIQSDGKIIVAGDGINSGSPSYVSIMARFNRDGTLDASFYGGGTRTDTIGTTSRAWVVKIQPDDGKIVIGGNYQDGSGPPSFYLARYDSNGAPDFSFNSGMVTASPGTDPVLADIAILPNRKIIVVGTTKGSINTDVFLMRFNADGTLDTTFGSAGTVLTDDVIHGREAAAGLAVQTDGKIIVSATFQPSIGAILTNDLALLRYDAEGVLDITFGNGYGMVTTDLGSGNDDITYDVLIQQDGKVVVVGTASNGSNDDIGLARYWP